MSDTALYYRYWGKAENRLQQSTRIAGGKMIKMDKIVIFKRRIL